MPSLVLEPEQLVYDAKLPQGMQGTIVPVIATLINTLFYTTYIIIIKSYDNIKYPLKILNINSHHLTTVCWKKTKTKVHCNFLVVDKDPKFGSWTFLVQSRHNGGTI